MSIPVHQQFTDDQKAEVARLFHEGKTQGQIGAVFTVPARTIAKLLQHLGLKRTQAEAASLAMKSDLNTPETVEKIRQLRPTHSLQQIVEIVGGSTSAVERICTKYNIKKPDNYSQLQSERMIKSWTDAKRQVASQKSYDLVTPELRQRLSEGSKELWKNEEYRAKQISVQKMVWSDITLRTKMSDILTGYWDNQERRDMMAAIQQLIWTDDKRAEMSEIQKKLWSDPVKCQKIKEVMQIIWADPAMREADSERLKKIWADPIMRQADAERTKKKWQDPAYIEKMAKVRAMQPRVSSIQTMLYSILDDLKIKHYREYPDKPADQECLIGPYNFDCVVPRGNGKTLAIECHGDYWHSLDRSIRVDKSKATYLERYCGTTHELKYLWEHEFGCKDRIVEIVKHWMGLKKLEVNEFSFDNIEIRTPPAVEYRLLLSKYHYLANAGRGGTVFGAYLGDTLIAVCVFSRLIRQNIDTGKYTADQVLDLSRLCVHPGYQKQNFASWFVSRCIRSLDQKIKLIISYCDKTFNHDGAIYKALNFKQDKVIRPDYWYASQDGWVMHKKTLYNRAIRLSLTESAFAEKFDYRKVFGAEKIRFVLER